jgi:hypothetical protein
MVVEIMPVFLEDGVAHRLRPRRETTWTVGCIDATPPRRLAVDALMGAGLQPSLIHSTSWRDLGDRVLLTHLAVIAPPHVPLDAFEALAIHPCELARGSALEPPPTIAVEQVLDHALRHLAWLLREDSSVSACLGDSWRHVLARYRPEPFRSLDLAFPVLGRAAGEGGAAG